MTSERLEWLELSTPAAPTAKKSSGAGQLACSICGWPVAQEAERCQHCGYGVSQETVDGLLAELKVQLLPRQIEITPAPDDWFDGARFDSPALYQLRLQAEQFRVSAGFDRLVSLDDINVDHYQYQLEAALRVLRDMRGRALLADEVGLGKTIEAGIVMKELIERGLANSVLILTPASLTWQWQEEMQTKFYEEFTVLEESAQLPASPNQDACRWIISLDRAKSAQWSNHLLAREYDLLIVDEAHKLKNHRTQSYRFVRQIRRQYILMLTATPVQNDLMELYNLVTLLHPGHLGTRQAFRENFIEEVAVTRKPTRRTIYSARAPNGYLKRSHKARQAYRQNGQDSWISNRTDTFADFDQLKLNRQGRKAAEEVRQLLGDGYEVIDFEAIETRFWGRTTTEFVCRLKLRPQAQREPEVRVSRQSRPRNPAALRQLLREVMIRNRRSSVGVRFPPRQAAIYALDLTPPERGLYDTVTAYIREQLRRHQAQEASEGRRMSTGALRMTLMSLQKQLCSTPQTVARALDKLVERQREADPHLVGALVLAWGIVQGRKVAAVLELLAQYPGKFLIFTDYLPTLQALEASLNEAGYKAVVFHGGLAAAERVEIVRSFRQEPETRVMISTQSGSEGHNLQFCHQMINFDLPWNPMRIEQRVGRLHRLGQPEAVSIFNLSANDTIEAYILDLLAHKIRMFELVIGELDLILGQLADEDSFEHYIEQAWAESQSEAELLELIQELDGVLEEALDTYQEVRSASDELSDVIEAFDEVDAFRAMGSA